MLTVENLEVSYGDVRALDGVSLEVAEGAIVAIVGANGAGKTTLIRTIAGMLRPAKGRIMLRDESIGGLESHRVCNLGIGQVAEGRQVFPTLTVLENLEIGAMLPRARADQAQNLERMFALFPKLAERAGQAAGTLSGGERNRLLLAKLFARPSNLLVMDEPTNDLDVETLSSLENALEKFPGCAVVISHDRWFLDRTCTHILAWEGDDDNDAKWFWFEGNFGAYEENKVERLGIDAARPHRVTHRRLTRD